jgi:uncharacterized membrane protein HdeD (DUF308 family)
MNTLPENTIFSKTEWDLPLGILFLILGIVTLFMPVFFHARLDAMLPWIFVAVSIFRLIYGIVTYRESDITINILLALIDLTIGIHLLQSDTQKLLTLALIIGIFLLVEGASKIMIAANRQSPWVGMLFLFSSVIGLLLGSAVWAGILVDVPWFLSAIIGIRIIYMGLTNLMIVINDFK